jgi:histone-lysine N-methyltransferase SETMAR
MHFFTLECKRASSEWRHQISPRPKKVSSQASPGKVLLTVYWDHKGVILEHYLEQREIINSERSDMLQNQLKPAIRTKRRSLSSSGVCLQHDNARTHTARRTIKQIQDLKLEVLPQPPYSPDLALSDFHLFWSLKDTLHGHHFRSDEELKEAVHDWLAQQPKDFFTRGIYALVERWRCVEHGGDYTED